MANSATSCNTSSFLLLKINARKKDEWNKLANTLIALWNKAGSPGMKTAEIERILLLESALTIGVENENPFNFSQENFVFGNIGAYVEKLRQAVDAFNNNSVKETITTSSKRVKSTVKKAAARKRK